jgi:hypothetical protein
MSVLRFNDFSGGLWDSQALNIYAPPNALLKAQNVEYVPGGEAVKLRGRRGINYKDQPANAGSILGLWRFYPRDTGSNDPQWLGLIQNSSSGNADFVHDNDEDGVFDDTLSGSPTGYTASKRFYGVNWPAKNRFYLTNGDAGLLYYDGTNITKITQAATSVYSGDDNIGPYIEVWKSRLWTVHETNINFSVYASDVNTDDVFPSGNQLSANDPDGGDIAGIVGIGDALLVFKTSGIWRFIGDIEFGERTGAKFIRYNTEGCISPDTIQLTPWGVVYLSRNGLRLTDGQSPVSENLSYPIRSLFVKPGTEMSYTTAVGGYYTRKDQYWLQLDPTDTDTTYICSRVQGPDGPLFLWARYTGIKLNAIADSPAENDPNGGDMFIGDNTGNIRQVDVANNDNGVETNIDSRIQVPFVRIGQSDRFGRVYRVKAIYRGKSALTLGILYDNNESSYAAFVSLGATKGSFQIQDVIAPVRSNSNWGHFIGCDIIFPATGHEGEFYELAFDIKYRGPLAWKRDFIQVETEP